MSRPPLRSNSDLLDDLKRQVQDRPKLRLHVNHGAAMWIAISVMHMNLSQHVTVVPDFHVTEAGLGWVEEIHVEQWRAMRDLIGQRVHVDSELGRLIGTLVELSDDEAVVDLGGNDRRYVRWLSVEEAR